MKLRFAFDTSALVSLGHTGLFELIHETCEIIITSSIVDELNEIAERNDEDAKSAMAWLNRIEGITVDLMGDESRKEYAELDVAQVCDEKDIPMVTDDIRAMKKIDAGIVCLFSVHIIYLLVKKEVISRQRGILAIEKMRKSRDWKNNLIYTLGRSLFDQL